MRPRTALLSVLVLTSCGQPLPRLPDGHPCFYIAPVRDNGVWYVEDDTARLGGPYFTERQATRMSRKFCDERVHHPNVGG
jgi:hypothetical protein